ncbi:MAG: ankyrin repeat domain-containing protein [Chlamydiales bacterium]
MKKLWILLNFLFVITNKNVFGYDDFLNAIRDNQIEAVKSYIESGTDVNAHCGVNLPLNIAVSYARFEIAKYLIDSGANPNEPDRWGNKPLAFCTRALGNLYVDERKNDFINTIQLLIDLGADVNSTDSNGFRAIFWAIHHPYLKFISNGNFETCFAELLLNNGANLDWPNDHDKIALNTFLKTINKNLGESQNSSEKNQNASEVPIATIDPRDLSKLVELPFFGSIDHSFKIYNKNSKNETVGIATFQKDRNTERIAWFWSPLNGFTIVTTQNELLEVFGKNKFKVPFQFYELQINESGVVAGSFLIDQPKTNGKIFNQCPWFWWSIDEGVHLNPAPQSYQLLAKINNYDLVLLEDYSEDKLIIKDIHNNIPSKTIFYYPKNELSEVAKDVLKDLYKKINYTESRNLTIRSIQWYPLVINSFNDESKIVGEGSFQAEIYIPSKRHQIDHWTGKIILEIDNGIATYYLKSLSFYNSNEKFVLYVKEI